MDVWIDAYRTVGKVGAGMMEKQKETATWKRVQLERENGRQLIGYEGPALMFYVKKR